MLSVVIIILLHFWCADEVRLFRQSGPDPLSARRVVDLTLGDHDGRTQSVGVSVMREKGSCYITWCSKHWVKARNKTLTHQWYFWLQKGSYHLLHMFECPPKPAPARIEKPAPVPREKPSEEAVMYCPVCLERIKEASSTVCGHIFCTICITSSLKVRNNCPKCRKKVTMRQVHRLYI